MAQAADEFADIAARMKATQAPVEDPDAELVRLHHALVAQEEALARIQAEEATGRGITPASREQERRRLREANDVWWELADEITDAPAQGLAGQRAKAAAMLLVLEHVVGNGIDESLADIATGDVGELEHRLALSLARDILGGEETGAA